MIEVKNIVKVTCSGDKVINDISFEVNKGESLSILGDNMTEKTTLIDILTLNSNLTSGIINYLGTRIDWLKNKEKNSIILEKFGIIRESSDIMNELTIEENINFFRIISDKEKDEKMYESLIKDLDISDLLLKSTEELNLSERVKVLLAAIMYKKPTVIFAEEPSKGLDDNIGREFIKLIINITKKNGITLIYTTNSSEQAHEADNFVHISSGKLLLTDDTEKLYGMN